MEWSDLRARFPRVLIASAAVGLILTLVVVRDFDVLTWLALTGVALLAHAVGATTIWALDRMTSDEEPRRPGSA